MLNPAQARAVTRTGHCVITACPGSGKTTVLKYRAAHLLDTFPDAYVLGVTFTSEAAAELKTRISAEVPHAVDRVTCGTFHALCKRQLERSGRHFKLINEGQRSAMAYRAYMEEIDPDSGYSFEDALALIDSVKASPTPHLPADSRAAVYRHYQAELAQMGAMDFSDLLVETVKGMNADTIAPWPITHMLVDEAQDADAVQMAWVYAHVANGVETTIVGDDDQSIFGWRWALGHKAFVDFQRMSGAELITLDTTYRCAEEIFKSCGTLIAHNTERIPKTLRTANRDRGEIRVRRFESREVEIETMIAAIRQSGAPGDWGILARTNSILDKAEKAFKAADVPCIRSGGTPFWQRATPALFLNLCRSVSRGDMVGLSEVLRATGAGAGAVNKLHAQCDSAHAGAFGRFLRARVPADRHDPVTRLQKQVRQWRSMLHGRPATVKAAVNGMAWYLNSHNFTNAKNPKTEARAKETMNSCAKSFNAINGSIGHRLNVLDRDRNKTPDIGASVRLMTLHASKGLEFPRVWVFGCENGVLPSKKGVLAEERRLMYVGMTRAKTDLTLSCSVEDEDARPSVFISEAGLL